MREITLEDRVVTTQLRRAVELKPDATFIEFPDISYSYAAFDELTNSVANSLRALGLQKYGKIAILARNGPEFISTWFAAAKLGAMYVPINTDYKGEILRYQLNNADVTHILIDSEFVERLDEVISELPNLKHVIVSGASDIHGSLHNCTVLTASELSHGARHDPGVDIAFDDPHAISFTSGTTGPSKGVLTVNAHVIRFAWDWARYMKFETHEAIYTPLPMFHAIGSWLGVLPTVLNAARIAVAPRFSASSYWNDVRGAKADIAHGIFSMVPILLKQPERPDDADQPARAFYNGNENPEFERRFNCRIVEVYGATETGIVAGNDVTSKRVHGSCGKPNDETFELSIVDDHDAPVKAGEIGEIVIRPREPHAILREYYKKPEATAEAFRNLWFHTGDNGKIDDSGNLFFIDRKKDAIRRRGENISSYELEFAINCHPEILECAAVAVLSELGEDDVKVVVVLKPGTRTTAADLWRFFEEKLPRFWIPSYIELTHQLPKTGSHKVQKFLLRERGKANALYARDAKTGEIREL